MVRDEAVAEANRCLFCFDAPCIAACPTAIDIPQFIRKIATDNVESSARTIFEANILGTSCARVCPVEVLCVGACVYNHLDQPPIQIGRLQRYATDAAMERGTRFFSAGPDSGKHVALIGAGPASLAAAHELRRRGHKCTIYEKRSTIGGLNATGVAPYKMQADAAVTEAQWILGIGGIDVRLNSPIEGHDHLIELERTHDAVFVGIGLGADSHLGVPGQQLPGVHGAVEWIEQMKVATVQVAGVRSCVVVGGGNTALDAVREVVGLGVPSVTLLYRGPRVHASGYEHELAFALNEGVHTEWFGVPTGFEGEGRVERVHCARLDAHRRPIAGGAFTLPADLVLVAIGQSRLSGMFAGMEGITIERGHFATDDHGFTGRRGWYAGGDCRNGGKEVVNAASEGKTAAIAMDAYLRSTTGANGAASRG